MKENWIAEEGVPDCNESPVEVSDLLPG